MSKELTITKITAKGAKVSEVAGTIQGTAVTLKAWSGDITSWAVGQVVPVETEMRPGYNGGPEERWIKSPPKARGGGAGGPAKSDPAKNANIAATNALNNATNCVQMAVTLHGPGADLNAVRATAAELASVVQDIQRKFVAGAAH